MPKGHVRPAQLLAVPSSLCPTPSSPIPSQHRTTGCGAPPRGARHAQTQPCPSPRMLSCLFSTLAPAQLLGLAMCCPPPRWTRLSAKVWLPPPTAAAVMRGDTVPWGAPRLPARQSRRRCRPTRASLTSSALRPCGWSRRAFATSQSKTAWVRWSSSPARSPGFLLQFSLWILSGGN